MMDVMKQASEKKLAKEVDYWSAEGVGAITGGEAAAALTAVWYVPTILSAKDQAGKWAVARIPMLETVPNATNASNIGGSSWFVMEESKKKELAIDFLNTVYAGNNDFYQQILVERGAVGTYIPSQSGEAYTTPVEQFGGQKVYEDFSNWAKEVPSISYGTYTDEAADSVAAVLQDYYDGKLTKDQALQQAEENLKTQTGN
jgi:lactose/L-arabinose transport system substrate-binding protein